MAQAHHGPLLGGRTEGYLRAVEEPRQSNLEARAEVVRLMADQIVMRIERRDGPDAPARWEEFKVPSHPNANVICVLIGIKSTSALTVRDLTMTCSLVASCLEV